jgi:hypothetical protein
MTRHALRYASTLLCVAMLTGCQAASNLLYEPAADDPLDGLKGSLAEAGVNTDMDWGPKQELLLSEHSALKEAHADLERQFRDLRAQNDNLLTQLGGEKGQLEKERAISAQAEAETELLRQRRRELEARILSLSIEKAKLEQQNLLVKLDSLRASMEQNVPEPVDAAAPPPRSR